MSKDYVVYIQYIKVISIQVRHIDFTKFLNFTFVVAFCTYISQISIPLTLGLFKYISYRRFSTFLNFTLIILKCCK